MDNPYNSKDDQTPEFEFDVEDDGTNHLPTKDQSLSWPDQVIGKPPEDSSGSGLFPPSIDPQKAFPDNSSTNQAPINPPAPSPGPPPAPSPGPPPVPPVKPDINPLDLPAPAPESHLPIPKPPEPLDEMDEPPTFKDFKVPDFVPKDLGEVKESKEEKQQPEVNTNSLPLREESNSSADDISRLASRPFQSGEQSEEFKSKNQNKSLDQTPGTINKPRMKEREVKKTPPPKDPPKKAVIIEENKSRMPSSLPLVLSIVGALCGLIALLSSLGILTLAQVSNNSLGDNSVNSQKVIDGSLTRADLNPTDLPQGAKGDPGTRGPRGPLGPPGLIKLQQVTKNSPSSPDNKLLTVTCPGKKIAIGGGAEIIGGDQTVAISSSAPVQDNSGWRVTAFKTSARGDSTWAIKAYALCALVGDSSK